MEITGYINTTCRELNLPNDYSACCKNVFSSISDNILLSGREKHVIAYNIMSWVADVKYGKQYPFKKKDIKSKLKVSTGRPATADITGVKRWNQFQTLVKETYLKLKAGAQTPKLHTKNYSILNPVIVPEVTINFCSVNGV